MADEIPPFDSSKVKNGNGVKKDIVDKRIHAVIAIIEIILAFGFFALIILHEIPDGKRDMVMLILGATLTHLSMMYPYFFGSSKGSDAKNQTLSNALETSMNNSK